jgi:replicative DNA helicase
MAELKPPYDLDAEKNVLSSILIDRDALIKAAEVLDDVDFYDPAHQVIYGACKELFERSSAVDIVTLKSHLSKAKLLKKAGGEQYIYDLVSILPLTTNVEFYSSIIKEASLRRRIISMSSDLVGMGMDETKKLDEIIDEVEKKIFAVAQNSKTKGYTHIKDILKDIDVRFEELQNPDSKHKGYSSGFPSLDKIIGGLHPGDLVVLAARPSVGKTAFMLEICRHLAVNLKKKIAIFSLEMSKDQLADRLLSLQSGLNLFDIRMGNLDAGAYKKYMDSAGELYETDIFIDDVPGQYISDVRTKCRKWELDLGVDAIFVDYLQLLHAHGYKDNRALEVSNISQTLKNIARELKVPVVALSQLNRAVESRNDRRPQLSDIRESGAIEQDADMVMFLHRESRYKIDDESIKDKAEVIVAKNRNGSTGIIEMKFVGEQAKYVDIGSEAQ